MSSFDWSYLPSLYEKPKTQFLIDSTAKGTATLLFMFVLLSVAVH